MACDKAWASGFTLPPYSLWSSATSLPIATANCLAKAQIGHLTMNATTEW